MRRKRISCFACFASKYHLPSAFTIGMGSGQLVLPTSRTLREGCCGSDTTCIFSLAFSTKAFRLFSSATGSLVTRMSCDDGPRIFIALSTSPLLTALTRALAAACGDEKASPSGVCPASSAHAARTSVPVPTKRLFNICITFSSRRDQSLMTRGWRFGGHDFRPGSCLQKRFRYVRYSRNCRRPHYGFRCG